MTTNQRKLRSHKTHPIKNHRSGHKYYHPAKKQGSRKRVKRGSR